MATAAMSHQLGSPRGFRCRPGIERSGVGLIDLEEEGDLDFGLECCGEIWSLKYLLCVIGHLVYRAVLPEWRYSNVSRVCTGKANQDAK